MYSIYELLNGSIQFLLLEGKVLVLRCNKGKEGKTY